MRPLVRSEYFEVHFGRPSIYQLDFPKTNFVARYLTTFPSDTGKTKIMASEKRAASNSFGSQMVVKKQNVGNNSKAVSTVNGSSANGALIQSVCICLKIFWDLC